MALISSIIFKDKLNKMWSNIKKPFYDRTGNRSRKQGLWYQSHMRSLSIRAKRHSLLLLTFIVTPEPSPIMSAETQTRDPEGQPFPQGGYVFSVGENSLLKTLLMSAQQNTFHPP